MKSLRFQLAATLLVAAAAPGQTEPGPRLLSPLPDHGAVPAIVDLSMPPAEELARRARQRDYRFQIRTIAHEYLGPIRAPQVRARGIAELRNFTDPVAYEPLIEELAREDDDVRLAVMDLFAEHGDEGQAALAWVGIHDDQPRIRDEAVRRLRAPASDPVLAIIEGGLRSNRHAVANRAGVVAGAVNALETIPLLIFAQAARDQVESQGDLAWIAIQTQRAFVARVDPVVGNGAAAFQAIPGIVNEGVILRVYDAVAIIYRTEIHFVLVRMTSQDWGKSTDHLGYDINRWWEWYNDEYVPFKNELALIERLAAEPADTQVPPD